MRQVNTWFGLLIIIGGIVGARFLAMFMMTRSKR